MKYTAYEQFAIVKENSASFFTAKLNEELKRLRYNNPSVTFSEYYPLCAYIHYVVSESTPESIAEASAIEGVSFVCAQCPNFRYVKRADGEENKSCKWGDCDLAELGRTRKDTAACEELYKLIKEGSVKLCWRD